MITLDEILKLRELEAKAMPRDWEAIPTGMNRDHMRDIHGVISSHNKTPYISLNNANLICALRNSAPDLIELAIWALEAKNVLSLIASPSEFNCAIGEGNQRAAASSHLQKFPKGSKG